MTSINNCSEITQAKNPKRKLDHLADLADGFDQWDMIPRRLSRAYIDGKFPESKFRLLLCMMSHSGGFHIKQSYLQDRFCHKTLRKYIDELIKQGYIALESIQNQAGTHINLYHVRPLRDWDIYSQTVEVGANPLRDSVEVGVNPVGTSSDHKDFNLKDFNSELDPHTHTAPKGADKTEKPPKKEAKPKTQAEELAEKFGNELYKYGVIIDLKLMAMNIGLVSQNLGKSWEWMDQTFGEAVGYLCGRRNYVAMDVGHDYFKWCKNYRDIPKTPTGNRQKKATGSGTGKVSKFDPQAELAKLVESQND